MSIRELLMPTELRGTGGRIPDELVDYLTKDIDGVAMDRIELAARAWSGKHTATRHRVQGTFYFHMPYLMPQTFRQFITASVEKSRPLVVACLMEQNGHTVIPGRLPTVDVVTSFADKGSPFSTHECRFQLSGLVDITPLLGSFQSMLAGEGNYLPVIERRNREVIL